MDLNDVEWSCFKVGDVFEVINSKAYHKKNLSDELSNPIPYISRTMFNNGLELIVEDEEDFKKNPKDTIVFGAESALFFYEPFEYITGNKMYYLKDNNFDKYVCLFITSALNNSIKNSKFDYYHGLTGSRLKEYKIILPVDEEGNLNFSFMKDYMKYMEMNNLKKYNEFLETKLTDLHYSPISPLDEKIWKAFELSEIFNIESTKKGIDKNKIKDKDIVGEYPYITRSEKNNGYNLFICEQEYELNPNNVISIGLDTQTVFYQNYPFYTGQNIQILHNEFLNKYNSLFIVTLLKKVLNKFNWGSNGATLTRLKKSKILLPVTSTNTPDYEYMAQYMINLEINSLNKYSQYLSK